MTPRTASRGSRPALIGAIMTYIGAGFLLLGGVTFILGTGQGTFFGQPVAEVSLSGIPVAIADTPTVGAVLVVVALALVVLTVLTRRGHRAGLPGLTVVGAVAIGWLLYAAVTRDPVSPLVPTAWIILALLLLWSAGPAGRT